MSALLLAGSAAYAALKWKTVIPTLTSSTTKLLDVSKWSINTVGFAAEPFIAAIGAGAIAAYTVATEDELTTRTVEEELAYAVLASALGTLMWPKVSHWVLSTLTLTGILTSALIVRDETRWWGVAVVGTIAGYAAAFVNYKKNVKKAEAPE